MDILESEVADRPIEPNAPREGAQRSPVRERARGAVWVLVCAGALAQCKAEFIGPYPCETPYASCVDPKLNQCETDLSSEAIHCGACNRTCDVGALCQNALCGASPQKLADLSGGTSYLLAVNGSAAYFGSTSDSKLSAVSLNGGSPSAVATDVNGCGSGVTFAVDDNAVYYWTSNFSCSGGGCQSTGIVGIPVGSSTPSMLVPSSSPNNMGCATALTVANGKLFWLTNQNNSLTLLTAPATGGAAAPLATLPNTNSLGSLWITRTKALFVTSQNGSPMMLQEVPLDGSPGMQIKLQQSDKLGVLNIFVADETQAYVAAGGCPCDGSAKNSSPPGRIDKFALDGSGATTLAEFTGIVSSMARDVTHVYWATEDTIGRAPMAGGPATKLAGNLTKGMTKSACTGGCGAQLTNNVSIAVNATGVYVADGWPNVNALFKVKK
jgi:hypothetical protein